MCYYRICINIFLFNRLDSLENPAKPPIVMYKHTNHWDNFKTGLEPADQEIVDRLRKLKEEDKTSALSVDEIKRRLALLKDEDPDASHCNVNINNVVECHSVILLRERCEEHCFM